MKVLGLVASARRLGNSEILAKEMLACLPEDTDKKLIRLTDLDIRQCNACYACLPEGSKCVIPDDLEFLFEQIRQADAVILATPCYFLGTHTTLKMISDRLISVLHEAKAFTGKKCVVAVSYGIEGWEGYAREAAVSLAKFLHLDVTGTMLVRAASPGEVVEPAVLAEAHRLAATLITGEHIRPDAALHCCAVCGSTLLQLSPVGAVHCRLCGASGRLEADGPEFRICFDKPAHSRFSPEGMTEHAKTLEAVKAHFIAERQQLNKLRKPYQAFDWWLKPDGK